MSREKRTIWTTEERNKVLSSAKDMAKNRKLPFVKHVQLMQLLNDAQVVLQEYRRRKFYGIDSIGEEWLNELKAAGLVPADWHTAHALKMMKKTGGEAAPLDKNLIRINQLADERDEAIKRAEDLLEQNKGLVEQNMQYRRQLQSVPSEADVLKKFVADIFWDVESRRRALPGPTSTAINEAVKHLNPTPPPPPAAAKHDPLPKSEERPRLPKILIVGSKIPDFQKIEAEFRGKVDLSHWRDGDTVSLQAKAKHADMVYLRMGDVSHQQAAHVTNATDKFQRVSGYGNQIVIDLINAWLERKARDPTI